MPKKIIAAVVIFVLTIAVIGGAIVLIRRQSPTTVLSDADFNIITAGIKFTDAGQKSFVYQSPIYNYQLTIDTTKYDYSETSSGLTLYSKNYQDNISFRITAQKPFSADGTTLEKEVASYKQFAQSYTSGKVVTENDEQLDGNAAHKIVTTREGYAGSTKHVTIVLSVKDNLVYTLEYGQESETASGDDINPFTSQFKFIDSSKVETVVTYQSTLWGYQFTYDSRFWKLDSSSSRSESLSPRDFSLPQSDKANLDINSQEVSRFDLLGKETTYLGEAVTDRLGILQQSSSYPELNVTNNTDVSIAGRNGRVLEYDIKSEFSSQLTKYKEYMFLHNNALTRVTINFADVAGEGLKQADSVLNSLQFTPPTAGQVKGASTQVETEEKVSVQAKPAVARIFSIACGNIVVPYASSLPNTSSKSYRVCGGGYGSGFFINSDGYVATNGHVAVIDDTQAVYASLSSGFTADLLVSFYQDYFLSQRPNEAAPSKSDILTALKEDPSLLKELSLAVTKFVVKAGLTPKLTQDIYVSHSEHTFETSDDGKLLNPEDHFKASLVDSDYSPTEDVSTGKFSDVAILKLEKQADYPVLTLSPKFQLNTGASITIIGYPGVATDRGGVTEIISKSSQGIATVTRGIVSSIKQDAGGRNLIQTDAGIQHGNSGGPALDSDVNVVGLATYGIDSTNLNVNFLRDVQDLEKLMQKNNITNKKGPAQQKWEEGLELFWSGQFSKSVVAFEAARKAYPDLIDTDNLISVAKDKIANGLDAKDEPVGVASIIGNFSTTEIVLIVLVGLMAALMLTLIITLLRRKAPAPVVMAAPVAPLPMPVVIAPVPQPAVHMAVPVPTPDAVVTPPTL